MYGLVPTCYYTFILLYKVNSLWKQKILNSIICVISFHFINKFNITLSLESVEMLNLLWFLIHIWFSDAQVRSKVDTRRTLVMTYHIIGRMQMEFAKQLNTLSLGSVSTWMKWMNTFFKKLILFSKFLNCYFFMIYYDIVVWGVKLFRL
jgi:hypothetical protein